MLLYHLEKSEFRALVAAQALVLARYTYTDGGGDKLSKSGSGPKLVLEGLEPIDSIKVGLANMKAHRSVLLVMLFVYFFSVLSGLDWLAPSQVHHHAPASRPCACRRVCLLLR